MNVLDQKSQSGLLHSELPDAGCRKGMGLCAPTHPRPPRFVPMIFEAMPLLLQLSRSPRSEAKQADGDSAGVSCRTVG